MSTIINKINYCVFIGDDFTARLTIKQDGVAIDVSGYGFKMQIKSCKNNSVIIHELTTPTDIDAATAGAIGIITLTISKATTLLLEEEDAVYDLFWTDDAGNNKTIVQGDFRIKERITKN